MDFEKGAKATVMSNVCSASLLRINGHRKLQLFKWVPNIPKNPFLFIRRRVQKCIWRGRAKMTECPQIYMEAFERPKFSELGVEE